MNAANFNVNDAAVGSIPGNCLTFFETIACAEDTAKKEYETFLSWVDPPIHPNDGKTPETELPPPEAPPPTTDAKLPNNFSNVFLDISTIDKLILAINHQSSSEDKKFQDLAATIDNSVQLCTENDQNSKWIFYAMLEHIRQKVSLGLEGFTFFLRNFMNKHSEHRFCNATAAAAVAEKQKPKRRPRSKASEKIKCEEDNDKSVKGKKERRPRSKAVDVVKNDGDNDASVKGKKERRPRSKAVDKFKGEEDNDAGVKRKKEHRPRSKAVDVVDNDAVANKKKKIRRLSPTALPEKCEVFKKPKPNKSKFAEAEKKSQHIHHTPKKTKIFEKESKKNPNVSTKESLKRLALFV